MNDTTSTNEASEKPLPGLLQIIANCADLRAARDAYNMSSKAMKLEAAEYLGVLSYELWAEIIAIVGAKGLSAQTQTQAEA